MRAALGAVTGEIKSVRDEIKSVRDEIKSVREKSDRNFERLSTKIDATNRELHEVSERGIRTEARLGSLIWFWGSLGGVGGLLTIIMTIAKIFHWF